jgi:glycosyltransferase involved in cell wall biosynthesis
MHELAAALLEAGHEVRILTTGPRQTVGRVLGVEVHYLRSRREAVREEDGLGPQAPFAAEALARLATARIDVWHAFGTADAAAATVLSRVRPGVSSVYTELGIPVGWYRRGRPDHRLHGVVVRGIGAYCCYSRAAGACLEEDFGRKPAIVPGGVNLERFAPSTGRHPDPVLLFPNSLEEPRKNLGILLYAVELLLPAMPRLEVWLAGAGDPAAVLAGRPPAVRNAVRHLGVLGDDALVQRYRRAWVTALPSDQEAFGMSLIESMACGTPVVSLDRWGPVEIVTPEVGRMSPADPTALASACREALSLAERPSTVAACRAVAARYDWRTEIAPRMEAIYGELVAGAPRSPA